MRRRRACGYRRCAWCRSRAGDYRQAFAGFKPIEAGEDPILARSGLRLDLNNMDVLYNLACLPQRSGAISAAGLAIVLPSHLYSCLLYTSDAADE